MSPMIQCPRCDSYNDASALFCAQCGERMSETGVATPVSRTTAPPSRPAPSRAGEGSAIVKASWTLMALFAVALAAILAILFLHDESPRVDPPLAAEPRPVAISRPRPVEDETAPERPVQVEGDLAEVEPLSPAGLLQLARAATVTLELFDADGDRMKNTSGVLITERALVLARLGAILGASSGRCRIAGAGVHEVAGAVQVDAIRDLAVVGLGARVEAAPAGEVELPWLPVLAGDAARESLGAGLEVFVYSSNAWALSVVEAYPTSIQGAVNAATVAPVDDLPRNPLAAIDRFGFVVGLSRVVDREPDRPGTVLIDPIGRLQHALGLDASSTLADVTAAYYDGTYRALMDRARKMMAQSNVQAACDALFLALEQGLRESVSDAELQETSDLLARALESLRSRLEREGKLVELVGYLERGVDAFPDDRALWLALAGARQKLERHEQAIVAALEASRISQDAESDAVLQDAFLKLAASVSASGDLNAAAALLVEGIEVVPRSARLHFELAKIYQSWEYYDDAVRVFEVALELDPRLRPEVELYLERIDDALRRRDAIVIPKPQGSNAYRTQALVNGVANFGFLIDTGATYTAISTRMAQALGLDLSRAPTVGVRTANGVTRAPLVKLDSISIEGFAVRDVQTLVLFNLSGETGLLGLNFLEHFKYTFDSARGELILERP